MVQTTLLVLQPSTVQDPAIAVVLVCIHVSDGGGGNGGGSARYSYLSVVSCAPVSVSVTTVLYQNNSVYGVELFWTHRQVTMDSCGVCRDMMSSSTQSCSVPLYLVMVTSDASTDTYTVPDIYCSTSFCSYTFGISGGSIGPYNVSVACRNRLNQTGQPYVTGGLSKLSW